MGVIGIFVDARKSYAIIATVLAGTTVMVFGVLPLIASFF